MNAVRDSSMACLTFSAGAFVFCSDSTTLRPELAMSSRACWLARPFSVFSSRVLPFFLTASAAASIAASSARWSPRARSWARYTPSIESA